MKLFSQNEAEEFVKTGAREFQYHRGILITPGAKDVLTEANVKLVFNGEIKNASIESPGKFVRNGTSNDVKLFNSPEAKKIKDQICEIGRRMWMREYCDGNIGDISMRMANDRFIVTPADVSKGFMKPEMMSLVDISGNQLAGTWKCSGGFAAHAAIYSTTPEAVSVCHARPCHVGAFAIKELQPPPRLIPELELYVGQVAVASYQTPGSPELAESIKPLAPKHQSIILGCCGVICWGKSIEDAYFKMEITNNYCHTVILAQALPGSASIPCEKFTDLLEIKKGMGLPDNRFDLKPAELCEVDPWSQMCGEHGCSSPTNAPSVTTPDIETLVQKLTDEIVSSLNK